MTRPGYITPAILGDVANCAHRANEGRSTNLTQSRHLWYTSGMKSEMQATVRTARYEPLYPYERYYPYARIPGSLLT